MIEIQKPERLNAQLLFEQMNAAGFEGRTNWMYADQDETGHGTVVRFLDIGEEDRAAVEAVFAGHAATADAEEARQEAETDNKRTIEEQAELALAWNKDDITANNAFLGISGTPSNAQILAQVKELTRQSTRQARELNGAIRLLLGRFEGTD